MRFYGSAARVTAHCTRECMQIYIIFASVTARMRENPKNKTLTISTT